MAGPFELHREVKSGNTARVRELLANGADINATDSKGYTPLMYGLRSPTASAELVALLLDHGGELAEGDASDGSGANIVANCLRGGDPTKLALILDRGGDLRYRNADGYDALMDAVF